MRTERILITGCAGMLGSAVYPYFLLRYENVLATDKLANEDWLTELDVRDEARLKMIFDEFCPDIVLHLAAETSLEYCETHEDVAVATNAMATKTIGCLCRETGATCVYISTAGVFDGSKHTFYTEDDQPDPIMVYGQTKYDGERYVLSICPQTFVVRAGWMMGGGRKKEKKFIYKILEQVRKNRKEIFAVDDLWGTPTYTLDFARNLFQLLDTRKYGLYHMVCEGKGTRYKVAETILQICNRTDIRLIPVNSDFFKAEYFVQRPQSEMMINRNLARIGLNKICPWETALKNYIKTYFLDYIRGSSLNKNCRKHIRENCPGSIRVRLNGKESVSELVDLSISGVGFLSDMQFEPGQSVYVNSQSKKEYPWHNGVVKYALDTGKTYHVGIEFRNENPYAALYLLDK